MLKRRNGVYEMVLFDPDLRGVKMVEDISYG
jgi:hypothetical protein